MNWPSSYEILVNYHYSLIPKERCRWGSLRETLRKQRRLPRGKTGIAGQASPGSDQLKLACWWVSCSQVNWDSYSLPGFLNCVGLAMRERKAAFQEGISSLDCGSRRADSGFEMALVVVVVVVVLFCFLAPRHMGSQLPHQGSNQHPLHWKVKS